MPKSKKSIKGIFGRRKRKVGVLTAEKLDTIVEQFNKSSKENKKLLFTLESKIRSLNLSLAGASSLEKKLASDRKSLADLAKSPKATEDRAKYIQKLGKLERAIDRSEKSMAEKKKKFEKESKFLEADLRITVETLEKLIPWQEELNTISQKLLAHLDSGEKTLPRTKTGNPLDKEIDDFISKLSDAEQGVNEAFSDYKVLSGKPHELAPAQLSTRRGPQL